MTTTDAIAPLAPEHRACDDSARTDAPPFVFHRHRGPVTTATWIPGTQRILTAAYDGAIARFDLDTDEVTLFGHHDHLANRVVVSDDGLRAASVSSDYSAIVWDARTGQRLRRLVGHSDDVEDFCFIGAHMGASVSRDRRILVWDLRTGAIVRAIEGHERDVLSICADDRHLYTSGDDSTLRVWDIASGRQVRMWGPFETETDTCAIDPRHGRVVLGCDDGCIRVFAIHSGDLLAAIPAHRSGIKKVACSPVDGAILSAAYDQAIHLWSGDDFRHRLRLEARPRQWERSFNWSSDGAHVVAGTFDGTVLVWRADDGAFVTELGASQGTLGNDCFNDIAAIDDHGFATVNDAGHLRIGRFGDEGAHWLAQATPGTGRMLMNAVTSRDGGHRVVCGAHDQHLHVFERDGDGVPVAATWHHLGEGPINCVRGTTTAHGEDTLFVACYSGAIVRTDREGTPLARFAHHDNAVKALRLHPTRRIGVSCSADGVLTSWDFDGHLLHRFAGHTAIIDDLDLDPSGDFLATTGRDFHLLFYRLDDGVLLDAFDLGRRSPKGLCFVDRDTVVVSNYWGELLRVDLPTRTILRKAIATNGISAVARADASGTHLLASSYDGACYRVRSDTLEVVGELRAMRQRPAPGRD
ncbi:MAG: WD40 repeat domain-containing protein [Lysobacter sp.]|nr:WD40 repeat domain-containing protein [Lysobacter sp.]